ncbi:MAG: hypothetical protein HPY45_01320 [Anaerolineae bacterium]|nr:hypothetical protein [Anaerolineae bacterium]
MEIHRSVENTFQPLLPVLPSGFGGKIARIISNTGNPLILAIAASVLVASSVSTPSAWQWAFFQIFLTIALPAFYILWLLRQRKVTDFDIYYREQRIKPYLFTIFCVSAAWLITVIWQAPYLFRTITAAVLIELTCLFIINRYWKISAHSAGAASFASLLIYMGGVSALPMLVVIPIMAWSRLRLRRHTLLQTIAGSLLGICVFSLTLFTFS